MANTTQVAPCENYLPTTSSLENNVNYFLTASIIISTPVKVNREYVLECFLHDNPVLGDIQVYNFEPYGQDTVTAISRDHGAEIFLDKDARKCANKVTKDKMTIESLRKQVKGLQSVTSAYTKVFSV